MNPLYIIIPAILIAAIILVIYFYRKNNLSEKKSLLEEAGRFPPLSLISKTWLAFTKKGGGGKSQDGRNQASKVDDSKNNLSETSDAFEKIKDFEKRREKLDKTKVKDPDLIAEKKMLEEEIKKLKKIMPEKKEKPKEPSQKKSSGRKKAKEKKENSKEKGSEEDKQSKTSSGETSQVKFPEVAELKKGGVVEKGEGPLNLKKGKEIYNLFTTLIENKDDEKLVELIMKTQDEDIRALMKVKESLSVESKTKADSLLAKVTSKKELIELIKEEIINNLKSKHDILKGKISELRKKGDKAEHEGLVSLRIPPKIKMFRATFGKKDLDDVHSELKDLEDSINIKTGPDNKDKKAPGNNNHSGKDDTQNEKENKEAKPPAKTEENEKPKAQEKIKEARGKTSQEEPKQKAKPKAKAGKQRTKAKRSSARKPSARTSSKAKAKKDKGDRKKRR